MLSTYTLHHLTPAEKTIAFERCYRLLHPGGVALFGDLMFEDADARLTPQGTVQTAGNRLAS